LSFLLWIGLVLLSSERTACEQREKKIGLLTDRDDYILDFSPSVNLALPPVGWHKIVEQPAHTTTLWAWLKTVVIL
jgi:hypothetical protein